ncbi:abortive infection family protein [Streptomyces melanogenes]|uniref:abortive infection family protein n=1 Tax=Streptomyces melanogenes TaxID=67326 RepID=UPI00167D9B19|nr:abortive infection family protein [Streptomyces melanogenes]GGP80275.1 hypothetical protein GCM10010278_68420 [Streptomyces melanogenes]
MSSVELSASVTSKLRTFIRQGDERLEAIDAALRRLGVHTLDVADFDFEGERWALFADEVKHQTVAKAIKWVDGVDEYVKGYLEAPQARRVTRHPHDFKGLDHGGTLIENLRIAIRARQETLRQLVGKAVRTAAGADRDAAGGWPHLRDLGLVDGAVLDGYLGTMRARATVAQRRAAIGAAKELLEAVMKGAIVYATPEAMGFERDEMSQLWKRLKMIIQQEPSVDPALGGSDFGVVRLLNGQTTTVQGVAEVRNKVGTGHGKPNAPKGLKESHTVLVIDAVHTMTRFIAARLGELFP